VPRLESIVHPLNMHGLPAVESRSVPAQQFAILSKQPSTSSGMSPIGRRSELVATLSRYNTNPEREGDDVLYGPGIRIELPPGQDNVNQMLMTITEEEIAWLVIMRLSRALNWKIVDPNTGRELNA
jgi:hypothetical protein